MKETQTMYKPDFRLLALLLVMCGFLQACGFHLRGTIDLPESMKAVYVEGGSRSALTNELSRFLQNAGATIVERSSDATAILIIHQAKLDRHLLTVSSTTAKAQEYKLTYRAEFSIVKPGGGELLPRQTVTLIRDYQFDENDVLGKGSEEEILRKEMEKEMTLAMLRRLRIMKR